MVYKALVYFNNMLFIKAGSGIYLRQIDGVHAFHAVKTPKKNIDRGV